MGDGEGGSGEEGRLEEEGSGGEKQLQGGLKSHLDEDTSTLIRTNDFFPPQTLAMFQQQNPASLINLTAQRTDHFHPFPAAQGKATSESSQ